MSKQIKDTSECGRQEARPGDASAAPYVLKDHRTRVYWLGNNNVNLMKSWEDRPQYDSSLTVNAILSQFNIRATLPPDNLSAEQDCREQGNPAIPALCKHTVKLEHGLRSLGVTFQRERVDTSAGVSVSLNSIGTWLSNAVAGGTHIRTLWVNCAGCSVDEIDRAVEMMVRSWCFMVVAIAVHGKRIQLAGDDCPVYYHEWAGRELAASGGGRSWANLVERNHNLEEMCDREMGLRKEVQAHYEEQSVALKRKIEELEEGLEIVHRPSGDGQMISSPGNTTPGSEGPESPERLADTTPPRLTEEQEADSSLGLPRMVVKMVEQPVINVREQEADSSSDEDDREDTSQSVVDHGLARELGEAREIVTAQSREISSLRAALKQMEDLACDLEDRFSLYAEKACYYTATTDLTIQEAALLPRWTLEEQMTYHWILSRGMHSKNSVQAMYSHMYQKDVSENGSRRGIVTESSFNHFLRCANAFVEGGISSGDETKVVGALNAEAERLWTEQGNKMSDLLADFDRVLPGDSWSSAMHEMDMVGEGRCQRDRDPPIVAMSAEVAEELIKIGEQGKRGILEEDRRAALVESGLDEKFTFTRERIKEIRRRLPSVPCTERI
uniref:Uncharacterized protein n=1 Tax=viral metagenome TaxID=1070528 RepID=A0A2V0RBF6_9ZZZZ